MQTPLEISIDLTAQELSAPPALDAIVEVEDVCALDPLLDASAVAAANADATPATGTEESIEIELTSEQIAALLEGALSL